MKIIDLLVKISNGEEVPKKIRIDHWCYTFEWVEHLHNYYDEDCDIDLSSALSLDIEELNYGVEIIEEEKEIEKIKVRDWDKCIHDVTHTEKGLAIDIHEAQIKINEIIDLINDMRDKE